MTPKLSIIIPCYNIEPHISKCVESILEQTFNDFELLLINDGSKDNTLEVCREYEQKDTRVKVYSHDNKGVSYTRNRGIELAQGECILFIDGDDYVKPDYLEKLVANYADGIWPICGMINIRKGEVKENENYQRLLNHFTNRIIEKQDFLYLLKFYSYSSPCAKIYSKRIVIENQIYFDLSLSYQEDLMFNLEYSNYIDKVFCLDYFGYYYVAHGDSSSNKYHPVFNHIDQLYCTFKKIIPSGHKEEMVLKRFIFDTILKKLSNDFHPDSQLSKREKLEGIKLLTKSSSYNFAKDYIWDSSVNFLYKFILFSKNRYCIYTYLNFFVK